ncbi:MAG: sigma-54-dependent Fis family transcriptional regulator [Planctomycetota bacterium]|nr:MAG: sigma-54-dependent Fis family transcriptional regulator [Planctomycetota bacterium]
MSPTAEQQVLRYAADLAQLYARASEDRRRLRAAEERLVRLTEIALALVRSLSLEDVAARLTRIATTDLGLREAAVYLRERDRFALLAASEGASFPTYPGVVPDDVAALGGEADELECAPWSRLGEGGRVAVVPLAGREQVVGFLVGRGELPHLHAPEESLPEVHLLSLLAGHAGVVLENLRMEKRRGEGGLQGTPLAADAVLGNSPRMREVLALLGKLARVDSSVLLTGETGTGKSLLARSLHQASKRRDGPFVTLNCAAIPEALVESELFGHEAGAFTGAVRTHRGKVEQAAGGTLFLDEVGELPLPVQSKLLTFLEERRFARVGGEEELEADVRIVSATNRDLEEAVSEKRFRSDLLYRLNVFTVDVPPLRERGADVLLLARNIAAELATRYELPTPRFSAQCEERLLGYDWPGNVRELRNVLEKAVILSDGGEVSAALLPSASGAAGGGRARHEAPGDAGPLDEDRSPAPSLVIDANTSFGEAKARMIEQWEIAYVQTLLRMTGGNIARGARLAKLDKKNLHRKIKQYGIDVQALRDEGKS